MYMYNHDNWSLTELHNQYITDYWKNISQSVYYWSLTEHHNQYWTDNWENISQSVYYWLLKEDHNQYTDYWKNITTSIELITERTSQSVYMYNHDNWSLTEHHNQYITDYWKKITISILIIERTHHNQYWSSIDTCHRILILTISSQKI